MSYEISIIRKHNLKLLSEKPYITDDLKYSHLNPFPLKFVLFPNAKN